MVRNKKAKGPKTVEEAMGYLTGQFLSDEKAPHAIRIYGVTYLNQKALLQNLEVLRDRAIGDFKAEVKELMEQEDVDIRATKKWERATVANLEVVAGALIHYVEECVEFSEDDWDMKNYLGLFEED